VSSRVIYSYNQGSQGAVALAKAMDIKRLRHGGKSKWVGGKGKELINWGASEIPEQFAEGGTRIINPPWHVSRMSNKLTAFEVFRKAGVRIPECTSSLGQAQKWLGEGFTVFARTVLSGHSGIGIIMMEPEHIDTHQTQARLYTKYIPKNDEFRVHVVGDKVILVQRKGLKEEFKGDDVNWKIRNLANGFIFARNNIQTPQDVIDQALLAIRSSGLDFGAVDVIWNAKRAQAYVLEINTAPGLVGTTVEDYAKALGELK